MAETTGFKKELGLFDSSMLVAGSMIGSGIFIVTASMSQQLGSPGWILVVWLLTGGAYFDGSFGVWRIGRYVS